MHCTDPQGRVDSLEGRPRVSSSGRCVSFSSSKLFGQDVPLPAEALCVAASWRPSGEGLDGDSAVAEERLAGEPAPSAPPGPQGLCWALAPTHGGSGRRQVLPCCAGRAYILLNKGIFIFKKCLLF